MKKNTYRIATLLVVICLGLINTPQAKANRSYDNDHQKKVQDEPNKKKAFYVVALDPNLADQILYGKQSERNLGNEENFESESSHLENDRINSSEKVVSDSKPEPVCKSLAKTNTNCKLHYKPLK